MSFVKKGQKAKEDSAIEEVDRSVIVSNARIDRAGNEWKRKALWVRQEYLGKLKVLAHFQSTKTEALLDQALSEYLQKNFDNSMAMKEMVAKSTGKIPTVKV
jgi:TFIIF-interacting CTD phosphatase-like protein